jgi:hypothetical protein
MRVAAMIPLSMIDDEPMVRSHLEMVAEREGLKLAGPITTRVLSDAHHAALFGGEPTEIGIAEAPAVPG